MTAHDMIVLSLSAGADASAAAAHDASEGPDQQDRYARHSEEASALLALVERFGFASVVETLGVATEEAIGIHEGADHGSEQERTVGQLRAIAKCFEEVGQRLDWLRRQHLPAPATDLPPNFRKAVG